jgi:hypothetical protein
VLPISQLGTLNVDAQESFSSAFASDLNVFALEGGNDVVDVIVVFGKEQNIVDVDTGSDFLTNEEAGVMVGLMELKVLEVLP